MEFEQMNWMQVESYLADDDRVILVIGAIEQHGYLSLATDVHIPEQLARAASEQTGVLTAPAMPFGASHYFLGYPGTVSLRLSTLLAVLEDMVRSLYAHGFRRFIVLNGHGGNRGAKMRLDELAAELPAFKAFWYDWWISPVVLKIAEKHGLAPSHANWLEAFEFNRVVELPEGEKPFPGRGPSWHPDQVRRHFGDGVFGGHYLAAPEVMDEIFSACLEEVLGLISAI